LATGPRLGPLGEIRRSPDPLAVAGRGGNEGREEKGIPKEGRKDGEAAHQRTFSKVGAHVAHF